MEKITATNFDLLKLQAQASGYTDTQISEIIGNEKSKTQQTKKLEKFLKESKKLSKFFVLPKGKSNQISSSKNLYDSSQEENFVDTLDNYFGKDIADLLRQRKSLHEKLVMLSNLSLPDDSKKVGDLTPEEISALSTKIDRDNTSNQLARVEEQLSVRGLLLTSYFL